MVRRREDFQEKATPEPSTGSAPDGEPEEEVEDAVQATINEDPRPTWPGTALTLSTQPARARSTPGAHRTASITPATLNRGLFAAAIDASAALARLDEAVLRAAPHVRTGWVERWIILQAEASTRLDGGFVDVEQLLLDHAGALDGAGHEDLMTARNAVTLARLAVLRSPRQIFTPRRLAAAISLRSLEKAAERARARRDQLGLTALERRKVDGVQVLTAEEERRLASEEARLRRLMPHATDRREIEQALRGALDPAVVSGWRDLPGLLAAADLLSRWYGAGAGDHVGGAAGRHLADLWLRRAGTITAPVAGIAVGFRSRRKDYAPAPTERWMQVFLSATKEAANVGMRLLRDLEKADAVAQEVVAGSRSDSTIGRVAQTLIATPCATITQIAKGRRLTDEAVRKHIIRLRKARLVSEIADREAFRAWAMAGVLDVGVR